MLGVSRARRPQQACAVQGVSHVVVDEIHERGINEDLLLIILKDVLARRRDLKLVLMSATLNAAAFQGYFPGSAAVHIPGFTFPVDVRYLGDALQESGVAFPPTPALVRAPGLCVCAAGWSCSAGRQR